MVAVQDSVPWGLARIDQRARLSPARLAYEHEPQDGTGVDVYVLDTGIDPRTETSGAGPSGARTS